jgi:hypothetical protein
MALTFIISEFVYRESKITQYLMCTNIVLPITQNRYLNYQLFVDVISKGNKYKQNKKVTQQNQNITY